MTGFPLWPRCQAMVLTAGLGTRLYPLSLVRAKPAVPVGGEPLIRRILIWMAGHGVTDAVLNLHHRPETIARVVGDGSDLGVRVRYSWEHPLLGSAGGPRRALDLLDPDRFFLINGDSLTDVSLAALARAHTASGAWVTLAVMPNPAPDRYGGVLTAPDGSVLRFTRPGVDRSAHHFTGVQIANAHVFAGIPFGQPAESVGDLYPRLIHERPGAVRAFLTAARFLDVGSPEDYFAAAMAMPPRGLATGCGSRTSVDPTAHLVRTMLWDDVQVGQECRLVECIVADGVRIPARTRLTRKLVVPAGTPGVADGLEQMGDLLLAPLRVGERTS